MLLYEGHNDLLTKAITFIFGPHGSFTGQSYGWIVKKKVILLEELKRDTPDFGGSVCDACMECCSVSYAFTSVILKGLFVKKQILHL